MNLLYANYVPNLSILYWEVMHREVEVCCPSTNSKLTVKRRFEPVTMEVHNVWLCHCGTQQSFHTENLSVKYFRALLKDLCVLEKNYLSDFKRPDGCPLWGITRKGWEQVREAKLRRRLFVSQDIPWRPLEPTLGFWIVYFWVPVSNVRRLYLNQPYSPYLHTTVEYFYLISLSVLILLFPM